MKHEILSITEIGLEELEKAILSLPAWRKEQTMRFKHVQGRKECAFAYLLLVKMLRENGVEGCPTFDYSEKGKPRLVEHPEIEFNLSHCRAAVGCAISERAVGIDIEMLGRYRERTARYTMNDAEMSEILASEDPDLTFTRLWTMKEATMKLIGDGISNNTRSILEEHSSNIIYNTTVNRQQGYVMTVAEWREE